MLRNLRMSIEAGLLISVGCTIYLACDIPYIGAFLFSVALCTICNMGMSLFTGKVCYANSHREIPPLLLCILGNFIGCFVGGTLIRFALPNIAAKATALCSGKILKAPLQVFILAIFCGMLMAIAVRTYKKFDGVAKYTGIFTCIPTFILCGFEHSIADAGYFFLSDSLPFLDVAVFMVCALLGNSVGGLVLSRKET